MASGNALLLALSPPVQGAMLGVARQVDAHAGARFNEQGALVTSVVFPVTAVLSVITRLEDGAAIEVSTVGKEGMVGVSVVLDPDRPANAGSVCQVAGQALLLPATRFCQLVDEYPELLRLCLRYAAALLTQVGQAVACSRLHSTTQRCARWLLMTQDRVGNDEFALTHEFLAFMLGVRRASVSGALAGLIDDGLIATRRGRIHVLDREGLKAASCKCYDVMEQAFDDVLYNHRPR